MKIFSIILAILSVVSSNPFPQPSGFAPGEESTESTDDTLVIETVRMSDLPSDIRIGLENCRTAPPECTESVKDKSSDHLVLANGQFYCFPSCSSTEDSDDEKD